MDILQIIAIGIIASILALIIKEQKPEFAILISIATGAIIFFMVFRRLDSVITVLKQFAAKADIDTLYFSTILKVIGIAYITDFGAQICRDSGEGAIASKVEFAGKILIMIIAIPILGALLDIIIKIIP